MNIKISSIRTIIFADKDTDGDYWIYCGNELIYKILDTFNADDWSYLYEDLNEWRDFEHSVFSRAILHYNSEKHSFQIDTYRIFFSEFILQTDLDDADCQLQDLIIYADKIKNPDLRFLEKLRSKVVILSNYKSTMHRKESFTEAQNIIANMIERSEK